MQKKGFKGAPDIHEAERQAAGLFCDKFPLLESMVIHMAYYQKGDNPLLMNRTLHVYPDRDYVFFHVPCLIHDCEGGSYQLTPVVVQMLKENRTFLEGRLDCKGSLNRELPDDHGHIQYRIEVKYKSAQTLKAEKEAARKKEDEARREAKAAAKKVAAEEKKVAVSAPVARRVPAKAAPVPAAKADVQKKVEPARMPSPSAPKPKSAVKRVQPPKKAEAVKKSVKAGPQKGVSFKSAAVKAKGKIVAPPAKPAKPPAKPKAATKPAVRPSARPKTKPSAPSKAVRPAMKKTASVSQPKAPAKKTLPRKSVPRKAAGKPGRGR